MWREHKNANQTDQMCDIFSKRPIAMKYNYISGSGKAWGPHWYKVYV